MRNNNIIVILASIIGLSFISANANAGCDNIYNSIITKCGNGYSGWPQKCDKLSSEKIYTSITDFGTYVDVKCTKDGSGTVDIKGEQQVSCAYLNAQTKIACAPPKPQNTTTVTSAQYLTTKPGSQQSSGNGSGGGSGGTSAPTTPPPIDGSLAGAKGDSDSGGNDAPLETTVNNRDYASTNGNGKDVTMFDSGTGKTYNIKGNQVYEMVNGNPVKVTDKEQKAQILANKQKEFDIDKLKNEKLATEYGEACKAPESEACKAKQKEVKKALKDKEKQAADAKESAEESALNALVKKHTDMVDATNDAVKTFSDEAKTARSQNPPQEEIAKTADEKRAACLAASHVQGGLAKPVAKLAGKGAKCQSTGGFAEVICPVALNPMVQQASTYMSFASTMITSLDSAYDTCNTTQKVNSFGQGLVATGTIVCSVSKTMCETSCGNSLKAVEEIESSSEAIAKCEDQRSKAAVETFLADVKTTKTSSNTQNDTCKKYAVSQQQMMAMAAGMGSAALQGKQCAEKLSALEGSNNSAQVYTMDEMCSQPQNASSSICKCRTDNTAPGCPGYISGNGNEGNINKDLNSKGLSQMAGLSYKSKISPTSGSGLDTNLDGLSDEAKKALAAGGDQKQDAAMFGGAGAANAGGGAGTASAGGGAAGADKVKMADEPKSFGSSFMNAVGSLFKGGSGSKGATAKDDKFASDKYKEQIKRQIAAEQMRSEISSASGMDNWTKIRTRYKSNASSLIDSN